MPGACFIIAQPLMGNEHIVGRVCTDGQIEVDSHGRRQRAQHPLLRSLNLLEFNKEIPMPRTSEHSSDTAGH